MPLSCKYFEFPHKHKDYRTMVLAILNSVLNIGEEKFTEYVHGGTYDGASVNACAFSPNHSERGINAEERMDRMRICREYSTFEEVTCICHRLVKLEEHVFNDKDNDASYLFKQAFKLINDVGGMVKASNKNTQELRNVQLADPERNNRRILRVRTAPDHRWCYVAMEVKTNCALWKYFKRMDVTKTNFSDSSDNLTNWIQALNNGTAVLPIVRKILLILLRIMQWIKIYQCKSIPTLSLVLYSIRDLTAVADLIGELSDNAEDQTAEIIASRFVAELKQEFENDLDSDYLKLAELLDPRVTEGYIVENKREVKRLLKLSRKFAKALPQIDGNESSDGKDNYDHECDYFRKNILTKVRVEVTVENAEDSLYDYWGGAHNQRTIDVYAFWRHFSVSIPLLNNVICQILSQRPASTTAETTFSLGGYCLNDLRTKLLPPRAEGFILSASAHKMKHGMKNLVVPILPELGKITEEDEAAFLYEDEIDVFAPINNNNLLNMIFTEDDNEIDDNYEE